ncbi:hypothetical protein B0H11DRAFT_1959698 [Mycena galericulata]|nr:hypothetical protein B0H11DRAFT_1959698 [Mycena galericulata]
MSIPCLACGFTTWNDLPAPTIPTPNPLALSNHPPNDLDVEEVRTFLTAANRRLEVLNQRISALAPVMNSLTHERDSLLADVRSHKAIVSPLRQLPSEIICRIFVMTLPPLRRLEMPRAPWFLGHICQRWRDIAVGLPILWSSFGIDNEGEKVKKLLEAAASISYDDAVQAQFSRTGQAPLQIAIISTGTSPYARSPLLDRLLAACHRWEVLDVTTEAYFLDMIQEIKGKMPALRHFSANRISPKSVEILESCPSLRGIQARKEGVPPSANVPWHNVTRYSGTVSSDQYLDIFRKTPNLVECRLKFSANANFNDISGDIVVLPSLKRLFVDGASCLERITAPRLEELALRGVLVECDPVRVLSFIERCYCTLDRLTILSGGENGDMSPRMPSLRELTVITKESLGPPFVDAMTPRDDDLHPLLPNLIAISVGDMAPPQVALRSFLKMIKSRAKQSRPLEFWGFLVNIHTSTPAVRLSQRKSASSAMLKLREAGLHIRLLQYEMLRRALDTDPYSIQRCSNYEGITTLELWEKPCTCKRV